METEKQKVKVIIGSVSVVKTGTAKSKKTGKPFKWSIQQISATNIATGKEAKFSSFDDFAGKEGMELECEIWQETVEKDGKTYTNWKIAYPKINIHERLARLEERITILEGGTKVAEPTDEIDEVPF